MMGQKLQLARGDLGELTFERIRDPGMEHASRLA
jgi:hypothetical protein